MPILTIEQTQLKPPLKWAGGKRWLTGRIQKHWESFASNNSNARLVEPFCGGLSVSLGLNPNEALLNDANPHVIAFYKALQQNMVIDIDKTALLNDAEAYYQNRELFNTYIRDNNYQSPEASALFYYLNRTGYNGLCRFNKSGLFNVPFGRYKTINYQTNFSDYQSALRNWQFQSADFEAIQTTPNDFIYVDPPYDVPFVSYAEKGFTWNDQTRLVQWLKKQPGPVIASNQATDRIIALYESNGFDISIIDAPRRIASNGNRKNAKELFALRLNN